MKTCSFIWLWAWALSVAAAEPQEFATLRLVATVPLPGVQGRFDHFAADANGHRIFVAALGNNTLEVIDAKQGRHLKSVTGLHKPTGVVYIADADRIGVANSDDGSFTILDGSTYELVKTLRSIDDADNVRLDARAKRLYIGYGDGALAIFDAASFEPLGRVNLPAHPESFQLEQQGSRIFVNLPNAKQIAVIDRERHSVVATWPMNRFQANFPMALDEAGHRLFVGCRRPARLVVFDTMAGKIVADVEISGDTDDVFYDPGLKRVYVSCGAGVVDVVEEAGSNAFQFRERVPTRAGARTSFFSAGLNRLVVAVPARGNQPAELRLFEPRAVR